MLNIIDIRNKDAARATTRPLASSLHIAIGRALLWLIGPAQDEKTRPILDHIKAVQDATDWIPSRERRSDPV